MPATAAYCGAIFGVVVASLKNGIMTLPWYRKPWEHVVCASIGAYSFVQIVEWEERTIARIEKYYASLQEQEDVRQSKLNS